MIMGKCRSQGKAKIIATPLLLKKENIAIRIFFVTVSQFGGESVIPLVRGTIPE
jgi:hypothetical protein